MVKISKLLALILIFCSLAVSKLIAEDNPDLNPASAGGATFIGENSPSSKVDDFLKKKGWKRGRNFKSNGDPFYVAVGEGAISANRDSKMIHDSRQAAFTEAFINAKTEYVKSLGLQISKDVSAKTYENLMPDTMAEDVINAAVGTDSNSFDKFKKLISVKFDNALKEEGYDPNMTDAEKEKIKKKVLRSREITELFTATAQQLIKGFQSYKTFEGAEPGQRGTITVIALGSGKLYKLADAIYAGSTNVPKGAPKKPIEEQLILDNADALLASFGTKMYVNENGNLVLVAYGQASPSFENDPGALSTACQIAESNAYGHMVSFANEQVMYDEMIKKVDKAETFIQNGVEAYEATNGREIDRLIKSNSNMKLEGQELIGTYKIRNPKLYKSTSCVAVAKWSAEGVSAINQTQNEMNSSSSTSSTTSNQEGQTTTEDQTPSDDF